MFSLVFWAGKIASTSDAQGIVVYFSAVSGWPLAEKRVADCLMSTWYAQDSNPVGLEIFSAKQSLREHKEWE